MAFILRLAIFAALFLVVRQIVRRALRGLFPSTPARRQPAEAEDPARPFEDKDIEEAEFEELP